MTIGQRIAECRRQLGLSQESLGEKMGVSRQAISKWEADAALPEIDKLIALSKLFGVSVGWLLGVEELPRQEQEPLTEEQLGAMEQLIKLYASPAPQKTDKTRMFPLLLSGLALILAMATALSCLTNHNQMSSSVAGLFHQVSILQNGYDSARAQIKDLETAETAPGTPESLHGFDFQLTPGTEEPTVNVHLSAIPKRHANETAVFSVRKDGREVANAECTWDGTAYVAQQELPLENGYEYWLIITDLAGNSEQIPMQDAHAQNLTDTFSLSCQIDRDKVFLSCDNNGELVVNSLMFRLQRPISMEDGDDYLWDSIELRVIQNGEKTYSHNFLSADSDVTLRRSVIHETSCAVAFYNPPVWLEDGDSIEVWLVAKVSNGMECLEMINSWGYEDGIFYGGELAQRVTQD